jgi:hypothetical protein
LQSGNYLLKMNFYTALQLIEKFNGINWLHGLMIEKFCQKILA